MNSHFTQHLLELRKRLIRSVVVIVLITCVLFPFSGMLFHYLAYPLLRQLPDGQHLIATNLIAPIFIPLKVVFILSFLISFPYFIYQFWTFVAPGLYKSEKKILWIIVIFSALLFYLGMIFTYFIVFPILFKFLISWVPVGVSSMPDITQYFDFSSKLFIAFGLTFEIPIVVLLLIYTNLVSLKTLIEIRPYFIVAAFIVGMLIMPPDVFSQTLVAVPMCILYQLGLWLGRYFL